MWYLDVMAIMRYRLSLQHNRSFQDLAITLVMASQDILVLVPFWPMDPLCWLGKQCIYIEKMGIRVLMRCA